MLSRVQIIYNVGLHNMNRLSRRSLSTSFYPKSHYEQLINRLATEGRPKEAEHTLLHLTRQVAAEPDSPDNEGDNESEPYICTKHFNLVIKAWANSRNPQRAEEILNFLCRFEAIRPDAVSFNTVMNGYSTMNKKKEVDRLWKLMEETPDVDPDVVSWNILLKSYASDVDKTLEICTKMKEAGVELTQASHKTLLNSLSTNSPERAEGYLRNLISIECPTITAPYFHTIIKGYLRQKKITRARELLTLIQQHPTVPTDNGCYLVLIDAYAMDNEPEQAEILLMEMLDDALTNDNIMVDSRPFNWVLTSYANQRGGASSAERILLKMEESVHDFPKVLADTISYNMVLKAWSMSDADGKVKKTEVLLERMERSKNDGATAVKPDVISYTTLGHCYSRSKVGLDKIKFLHDKMEALEIEEEQSGRSNRTMIFDTIAYNTVLNAIAQNSSPDTKTKSVELLHNILKTMNTKNVKIDTVTLNTSMNIYAVCGLGDKVFDLLKQLHYDAHPNVVTYNIMLKSLIKHGRIEDAYGLLRTMMDNYYKDNTSTKPDTDSFNNIIHGYAIKGQTEKCREVLNLLRKFNSYDNDPNTIPDCITYTQCIFSLSRVDDSNGEIVDEILAFLDEIEGENRKSNHDQGVAPDVKCYNSALNAIAKSKHPNKVKEATRVMERMEQNGCHPNLTTINTMLNACAYSLEGKTEALALAIQLYNELPRRNIKPDPITYTTLIRVAQKLIEDDEKKTKMTSSLFRDCCRSGLVDVKVMRQIENTLKPQDYKKLLGKHARTPVRNMPYTWTNRAKK